MIIKRGRRERLAQLEQAANGVKDGSIAEIVVYRNEDELDAWRRDNPGKLAVFVPDNGRNPVPA